MENPEKTAPALDATEKSNGREAKNDAQEKAKASKLHKRLHRYARSSYATVVALLPIVSFGLTAASIVAASWAHQPITADDTRWVDISPVNGNCTCDSTHVSYCAETSDAFEGTAYLSITIMGSQLLLACVYALELGLYGLFGGSHNYTRVTLIIALLALSTEILSVISWYSTFANNHCGDPSFETHGATLGWPFFFRCFECAGMFGFVLYITSLFPKTNRGPPSLPLATAVFTLLFSSVTTFSRGWMTNGAVSYSPWSACSCGDTASSVATMMSLALATGILAIIFGLITVFFMALRAVDNEGVTVRIASILSSVTALFQMLVIVGFFVPFNGELSDQGFERQWPASFAISAFSTQLLFVICNSIYMLRWPTETPVEGADLDASAGGGPVGSRADHELTVYYRFWWDHLKDPRTLAHEAREDDEDENAASESDDELDEADVLPDDNDDGKNADGDADAAEDGGKQAA
jgi:hypothetical protein